jgi:hypothetical protein
MKFPFLNFNIFIYNLYNYHDWKLLSHLFYNLDLLPNFYFHIINNHLDFYIFL